MAIAITSRNEVPWVQVNEETFEAVDANPVTAVAVSDDNFVYASRSGVMRRFDEPCLLVGALDAEPECASINDDLVALGVGRRILLLADGDVLALQGHRGKVTAVKVEQRLISSASEDRTFRIWDRADCN